jgi:sacsin
MTIGNTFGQHEPLTTRLHNLVRSYPKGLGILKEFIQNADDAEADEIVFHIDEQKYDVAGLPDAMQWLHTTPALLVYNNKAFSDTDIEGIQRIGESGKSFSVGKTGRFGLGFNACYNVTDVPCFFTNGKLYFFDPHFTTVPEASVASPGRSFDANELIEAGWPLLDAFTQFVENDDDFTGTVFRLPFRMDEQANQSKIKPEAYTVDDALDAVQQLQNMGSAILLFLKYVRNIKVTHRKPNGSIETLLSIQAVNYQEIIESRIEVNSLLSTSDSENILAVLSKHGDLFSNCLHRYDIEINGEKLSEIWRVIDGFFIDTERTSINSCQKMIESGEKALPYAGAAWLINSDRVSQGRVSCFLPVPIQTSMPIQINGYFDLDDSRQNMFLDRSTYGSARLRFEWNKTLLETSVVKAYIHLLESLRFDIDADKIDSYYNAFPKTVNNEESWEGWLTSSFYRQAATVDLFRCSGDIHWCKLSSTRTLPDKLSSIGSLLIAENFLPLPSPALPSYVKEGFIVNKINVPELTPNDLRIALKEQYDVNCLIVDAPKAYLQKQDYVYLLLDFCLSDNPKSDVNGLPLVIDCCERLRTLGLTNKPLYLKGSPLFDGEVFKDHPDWFVEPICTSKLFSFASERLRLLNMTSKNFIDELAEYVSSKTENETPKLNKNGLSENWLNAVFSRLLESDLSTLINKLDNIPLIPDQSQILQKMGTCATPLLFRGSSDLHHSLTQLSVPLVFSIGKELRILLEEISEKYDRIWSITPRDLIDTLSGQCSEILKEYNLLTEVQKALLDYLSQDGSLAALRKCNDRYASLKKLKLFPTAKGMLVDLSLPAYVSQDFKFPSVGFDVILLDDGINHKWRELYLLLGVPELSRSRLIREFLLPEFERFDGDERIKATAWLRDHIAIAQSEDENQNAVNLFEEVRNACIIVCEDGKLRAPINTYHPSSKLAKAILGDQASLPDMKTTYSRESKRWEEFFRQLDMPIEPQIKDVVHYVKTLVANEPTQEKLQSIQSAYKFIKDRADAEIQEHKNISAELTMALNTLAEIQWIPIRQDAGDFLCFSSSEEIYGYPKDIYFPRVGQLVASQAYITILNPEPNQQLRKVMGFPVKPPVDLVVAHFHELLVICSTPETIPDEKVLIPALGQIYRFFGGKAPKESGDVDDGVEEQNIEGTINLKETFADIPCIWEQSSKRFWKPGHVFTDNVKYMEPWRCTIRNTDAAIERGYGVLGRKREPTINDLIAVLEEIRDGTHLVVDQQAHKVIKEVIQRIVVELNNTEKSDGEVFVPTSDGRMLEAKKVFMGDAPWYESILNSSDVPILSSSVSGIVGIQSTLEISSLATSIEERLTRHPVDSDLETETEQCARLEELLHSNEFIHGLRRLLRHEEFEVSEASLSYLQEVHVRCVKSIHISLYLKTDGTERFLGDDETSFYWDHETFDAMLADNRRRYFCNDLAELLNRSLSDKSLRNLAPLVQILQCEPFEIPMVLDDLKIRQYQFEEEDTADKYDDEIPSQDFPNIDSEMERQGESGEEKSFDFSNQDSRSENGTSNDGCTTLTSELDDITQVNQANSISAISNSEENDDLTKITNQAPRHQGNSTATRLWEDEKEKNLNLPKGSSEPKNSQHEPAPHHKVATAKNTMNRYEDMEKSDSSQNEYTTKKSTSSRSQSAIQRRSVTYVSYEIQTDEIEESLSRDNSKRLRIGDEAVKIVIKHEHNEGRNARSMAHSNPGYDVISEGNGGTRYIEVKGTEAAWGERGVAMTSTQFFYARENPDRDYWLYVVEDVFSQTPQIHKIQNPCVQVDRFVFDGGWRQLAKSSQVVGIKLSIPSAGDAVLIDDQVVGVVESIRECGRFPLIIYRDLNGEQQKKRLVELTIKTKES